jgi:hypothetical protein
MKGGWRGTGIFPWNPSRVLRTLPEITAPPSPSEVNTTTSYLISSSPPDATTLRSTNQSFTEALDNNILTTPVRKHGEKLSKISEYLMADNVLLRQEMAELKGLVGKRTERASGKRVVLKGKFIVSTEEVYEGLRQAEEKTKKKTMKRRQKQLRQSTDEAEIEEQDVFHEGEPMEPEILDSIVVADR